MQTWVGINDLPPGSISMSFDLFVHCFREGKTATYPRRIAEEIFDFGALSPSEMSYVKYADGRGEIYCASDDDEINGFMLTHFGGQTICERALEIATVTRSLIYWPSTYILFAVTDKATLCHVPLEIKAGQMIIALVRTVDDLWRTINAEEDNIEGVEVIFP